MSIYNAILAPTEAPWYTVTPNPLSHYWTVTIGRPSLPNTVKRVHSPDALGSLTRDLQAQGHRKI